ncbi:fl(2)d-associated complex component-like, partial [Aphidius gifuensis]
MSKSNVKKIQVDATKCNADLRRPSVFERLGTKPISIVTTQQQTVSDYCRNWALNGSCSYGKTCKYANTHTLISPSKRVKKDITNASTVTQPKEDHFKRITSKLVSQTPQSPDLDLEEWNQTDLEYEDEKVLERRRQLLQKELELQMKKDKEVHGKDRSKHKKKAMSTSSSSHSSSTSSSSSSSSSDDSSTSSTSDSHKKIKKIKRHIGNNDERERKKKIKLKRLVAQKDNKIIKKKKKIDMTTTTSTTKRDSTNTNVKRVIVGNTRKHNDIKSRSPIPSLTTAASTTSKSIINKDKNHSESPKLKSRDDKEQRIHRKGRDYDDSINFQDITKCRNIDKLKNRINDNDRTIVKPRIKDKEQLKSRTPPLDQRPKQQQHVSQIIVKDTNINKFHRSRTPEKLLSRVKRDLTPPLRHQDKQLILQKAAAAGTSSSSSIRNRDIDKHEFHKNKERDDNNIRKNETFHKRTINQLPDNQRKNIIDERNSRSRIKEHHEKEQRNDRNQQRFDQQQQHQQQQQQQHKERDDIVDHRTRERTRERDKDLIKIRERELPLLSSSSPSGSFDKSRYREKEKDDKINSRDRRIDRNERDIKVLERERITQRFDRIIEKNERCERLERFPRERSLDKTIDTKNITSNIREHNITEQIYERGQTNRHRRFNQRFERGHSSTMIDHERKDIVTTKLERRDSPRQNIEFERGYTRLQNDHWEQSDESTTRIDYHSHDDERRKVPIETRKFINDRRTRDDTRPQSRYPVQDQRPFDDHHHHHPVHPSHPGHPGHPIHSAHQAHQIHPAHQLYNNSTDKLRPGIIRDENNGNDKWELPHEIEKHNRDRRYNNNNEWEEREWRPPAPRNPGIWDCETVTRPSDNNKDDWTERYDNPRPEWKIGENRKWENPALLLRNAAYRNERLKEMEHGANENGPHAKRRVPFNNPPVGENKDETIVTTTHVVNQIHPSKQLQSQPPSTSTLTSTSTSTLPSKTLTQSVTATTTASTSTPTAATTTPATTTTTAATPVASTTTTTITTPATTSTTTTPASSSSTTIVNPTLKEETINKKLIELSEGKIITDNNLIQKQVINENIKNETQDTSVPEIKKLDDSFQTHHVAESDLSDISDDPDDILNMDDVEESQKKLLKNEKNNSSIVSISINNNINNNNDNNNQEKNIVKLNINDNTIDDGGTSVIKQDKDKDDPITTSIDDENLETMDFEEISDGELEEDIKTSGKGLGDALGVDWESLVKEIQPKWPTSNNDIKSAHSRWQPKEIFRRIGISKKLAGNDFVDSFINELCSNDEHENNDYLLNDVAMMHTALLRHKLINNSTKKNSLFNINFNSFMINKINNPDILKPFTNLYDEAKFLLEQ